jgi:hypothetical protein
MLRTTGKRRQRTSSLVPPSSPAVRLDKTRQLVVVNTCSMWCPSLSLQDEHQKTARVAMKWRITLPWMQLAAALVLVLSNTTQTYFVSSIDTVCLDPPSQEQQTQTQDGHENPTCNTGNDAIPPLPLQNPECHLYMAESTIPGAGLGLFSAVSWNKGDSLHNEDVAIPLLELAWHHHHHRRQGVDTKDDGDDDDDDVVFDTTASYVWDGVSMGMQWEVEAGSEYGVSVYWPGLGASPNCHFEMINIATTGKGTSYHEDDNSSTTTTQQQQPARQRVSNPGAGAYSYYHGSTVTALRDIPAGSELFLSYGDN